MNTKLATATLLATAMLMPLTTFAAPQSRREEQRRKQTKEQWRDLATISGVIALLGLLKKDGTITFVGTAGALYSAYRYEEDRKSESKIRRARAEMFSRGSFTRDGNKYQRRTIWKGGKKYYQFVKVKRNSGRRG